MQSTSVATQTSTVTYEFVLSGGSCSASIIVQTNPGEYAVDSGAASFKGYAIVDGSSITFQAPGQSSPTTLPFIVHCHGGKDYQVLWADGCGIPNGSENGIATTGPYFGGGMPSLNWVSGAIYQLNLGTVGYELHLVSCKGWPIPASA